jgi:glycosyltransferase involved in cell wall biosynthesis
LKKRSLTVLVPALNEQDNIVPTLERLGHALQKSVEDYEIIVINDGSTDRTGEVVEKYATEHPSVRILHNQRNMGLGFSYVRGIHEATKDLSVYIPADNTWPYESFVELFGSIGRADIITSYASNPEVRYFSRRVVSRLYTIIMNILFCQRMKYFNGLTIYPIDSLRTTTITSTGFGFQAEILLKAIYRGLSVIELSLPIDDRTAGSSKAVNLRNILNVIVTVVCLFINLRLLRLCNRRRKIVEQMEAEQDSSDAI